METALNNFVNQRLSMVMLKRLRKITSKPIFLAHSPLPTEIPGETDGKKHEAYLRGIDLLNQFVFKNYDTEVLLQPSGTLSSPFRAASKYSSKSKRLLSGRLHDDRDRIHMNEKFGIIFLENFFKKLNFYTN